MKERDLFPLPRRQLPASVLGKSSYFLNRDGELLSRSTIRRVTQRFHKGVWCDEGIQTLNEVSGVPFDSPLQTPCKLAQRHAISRIEALYSRVPAPPPEFSTAGAFTELCGSASRYQPIEAATTAPYVKELVSWPPPDTRPVPVTDMLGGTGLASGIRNYIFKPEAERQATRSEPDQIKLSLGPTLVWNPRVYSEFLQRLEQAGMSSWRVEGESLLGVFFVK